MIETFTSKNRTFLHRYCLMARITGWMLLLLGFPWLWLKTVSVVTRIGRWKEMKEAWDNVPAGLFMFLVFGMVALGISELIRYLMKEDYQPGRLLRQGDKFLYFYACCVLLNSILIYLLDYPRAIPSTTPMVWRIIAIVVLVLVTLGKVVVLVGLGQLLKRIMPVIEETKTLI
jgi:hypothetical protein